MPFFKLRKGPSGGGGGGSDFKERYEQHKKLGSGGFSEVYSVIRKSDGEEFAAKIMDKKKLKSNGAPASIQLEIDILRSIQHENIIQLIDHLEDKKNIYVILTLITGGELFDRILEVGFYSEKSAANLVKQILSGIDYLHQSGIVHRDLKPENLLMLSSKPDCPVIISDFGLACRTDNEEHMRQSCGTPGYVAPEILLKKQYTEKVDCWSTGVITYILLCGYPPFYGDTDQEIYDMIRAGDFEYDSPSWDCISSSAKHFINCLIETNVLKRYSASEALKHEWILSEAPEVDLSVQVKENLKAFIAKSRWKKAMNAQRAIIRMQGAFKKKASTDATLNSAKVSSESQNGTSLSNSHAQSSSEKNDT